MQSDPGWTAEGEHGQIRKRPGTVSATAAQPLLDYLTSRYPLTRAIPMDFTANAVPEAQPGDIVAYDWEGDGAVDHLALVVNISSGAYPEVAEWGVGPLPRSGYQTRGWTWSNLKGRWLQVDHPNVRANLIHIDTTNITTF
ncbi:amidase domain-containing protein [Paractinoplanes atraurantiacus]|uniref:Putative amidase domain-containing protein n=1 Tax=Paractinoplanes atraurantiacus TaxID=1036182 RepID=A0A285K9L0_9ACTN|nr:amidase domain-containing protein [Actinoplanes atraurantiacus]SNY69299.1 Putative amidase domain-containing protein [Actinoplanes atraurantiacus]